MLGFLNEVRVEIGLKEKLLLSSISHEEDTQEELQHYEFSKGKEVHSGRFEGGFSYGERTGGGSFIFPNGDYYRGTWVKNKRNSRGICLFVDLSAYSGNWNQDTMEGNGIKLFKDGDCIEGEFRDNVLIEGQVRVRYRNGEIYEGGWKSDMREGKGIHFYLSGDIYEGIWHKDKRQGIGKIIFRDQMVYSGEFNQDRAEGRGKYIDRKRNFFSTLTVEELPSNEEESEDGITVSEREAGGWRGKQKKKKWSEAVEYQNLRALLLHSQRKSGSARPGHFFNGRLSGIGRIKFANGDEYIGEFKQGNRSGIGLMVYHSLRGVAGDHDEAVYLGDWKANQRDGWGRQTWMDGSQYEGEWKKDERIQGQMIMANKDEYNGHFKEDKFHGYGELKISKGRIFSGYFKEGQSPSKGTIRYLDGSFYKGEVITPMVFSEQLQARQFLKEGKGRMEYSNGDIYEGYWREDKNTGKGSKLYANGDHYEGDFFEDERQGEGRMFYSYNKHFYEGSWLQDQRSGFGVLIDKEGEVYRGGWKNDKQEGAGSNY